MSVHQEIDLQFDGRANAICCHRIGDYIVDPGPTTCVDTLLAAMDGERPRAILLTHIHLDHAAAAGALLRDHWPDAEVWVHERGARHMAEPAKLIASATQIYGDDMDRLWGEFVPVPEDRLVVLKGGESRDGFWVAYTPGHASHHVSYLHEDSGIAFTGDVASIRIGDGPIVPPTPPPDIDVELWLKSVEVLRAWKPSALAITHFGTFSDADHQLTATADGIQYWAERARLTTAEEFGEELMSVVGPDRPYTLAMPLAGLHAGLMRYWAKRESN